MDKRSKIIMIVFAVVLLGIIVTEIVRPKPIDWSSSFTAEDKIPFGCYVLYEELPTLFPDSKIEKVNKSLYEVLVDRDTTLTSNYLIINDHASLDEQETNQLLEFVSQGNSAFVAMTSADFYLADTLNIRYDYDYSVAEDSVSISLTHNDFKGQNYWMRRGMYNTHFISVDSSNTTILGHITFEQKNNLTQVVEKTVTKPNFIKTTFGKGDFYIHSTPLAFSNYYVLGGNQNYVNQVLSYLDDTHLYWDNYKKSGRVVIDSPMRFVLNQAALKWVYYLTVVTLILFVIFRAKREQRIIPVINPNENASVEFTRTVGSLYFQNKDYSDLVQKKLTYFLAYIRNHFYLDTSTLNEKTIQQLAAKSGKPLQEVKILVEYIIHLKGKSMHTEDDVINLNKKINAFKQ